MWGLVFAKDLPDALFPVCPVHQLSGQLSNFKLQSCALSSDL
jgi:hypothetical protein